MQAIQKKIKDYLINEQVMRCTFNVLNILPALWIGLFVAFVLVTSLEVSHIPSYGNPDPKDTVLSWVFILPLLLLLPMAIVSIPAWSLLAGMGVMNLLPVKPKLRHLLLLVLPILIFLWIRFQTGLFDWFGD
jgi:hypothetical protein